MDEEEQQVDGEEKDDSVQKRGQELGSSKCMTAAVVASGSLDSAPGWFLVGPCDRPVASDNVLQHCIWNSRVAMELNSGPCITLWAVWACT